MTEVQEVPAASGDEGRLEQAESGRSSVSITINTGPYTIERGRHTVVEIKRVGGVPAGDVLEEIVHGKLHILPDDGAVEITGGEAFLSHPRDSGSSPDEGARRHA